MDINFINQCNLIFANGVPLNAAISNPIDFFDRDMLRFFIKKCNPTCKKDPTSDYELFQAFLSARPKMQGHALVANFDATVRHALKINTPISVNTCEELWRACVEALTQTSRSFLDLIEGHNNSSPTHLVTDHHALPLRKAGIVPVLDANSMIHTHAETWNEWKHEMEERLSLFLDADRAKVYLSLPYHFSFVMPSRYEIDQTLSTPASKHDQNLLLSQVMRFLCEQKDKVSLILRINSHSTDVITMLSKYSKAVGLPSITWITPYPYVRDLMMEFETQGYAKKCSCGLFLSDYPSDAELEVALNAYTKRYPMGSLCIYSDCDIRAAFYETARLSKIKS